MEERSGHRPSSTCLLLAISASWVGVSQLARSAEERNELAQRCSVVPAVAWANVSAWLLLSLPHVVRRARETSTCGAPGRGPAALPRLLRTEAFGAVQPVQFLVLAVATNLAYIAALHFLPASLNTALFSTSPVFTLLLSARLLPTLGGGAATGAVRGRAIRCCWQALIVALSVMGVVLIAVPGNSVCAHRSGHESPQLPEGAGAPPDRGPWLRLPGVFLSLLAALGTAVYQVCFKATFGDRMGPEDVGLFLAYMGGLASIIFGLVLAVALAVGAYPLRLRLVPWGTVVSTALSSAVFNYLIKFGLSRDSPVVVSLATQIGIPLNLLLDVAVVHANISWTQGAGVLLMAASFALQQRSAAPRPPAAATARLLGGDACPAGSAP